MKAEKPYYTYAKEIVAGKIIACKWVKLSCKRFLDDLKRSKKKDFLYTFREDLADLVIEFAGMIRQTMGTTKPIDVQPWQAFFFSQLFGWVHKSDKTRRRFNFAYFGVSRKNGKTTIAALIELFTFILDGEPSPQNICAANSKDQARLLFQTMKDMVKMDSDLLELIEHFQYELKLTNAPGSVRYISADSHKQDGLNVSTCVLDEYHEAPNDLLYNVLRSSMSARRNPLFIITTTAGFNLASPCKREEDYAREILQGLKTNDNYFALIYTLDDHDDWHNQENWIKANPNLGVSKKLDYLQAQYTIAKQQGGSKEVEFCTKDLNQWRKAAMAWLPHQVYKPNLLRVDEEALLGCRCWIAWDLSFTLDMTAYSLTFEPNDAYSKPVTIFRFFIPEDRLSDRAAENPDFFQWADDGLVRLSPGNVIRRDFIMAALREDIEKFDVQEVCGDPYGSTELSESLQAETGIEFVAFRQSVMYMSPAIKNLERGIYEHSLFIEDTPIIAWMLDNTSLIITNDNNVKFLKVKDKISRRRIDGVVCLTMSYQRYTSAANAGDHSAQDQAEYIQHLLERGI